MRIKEINDGMRVYLNLEETIFLRRFMEHGYLENGYLDEREQEVASELVNKCVLKRARSNGRVVYVENFGSQRTKYSQED